MALFEKISLAEYLARITPQERERWVRAMSRANHDREDAKGRESTRPERTG
jgi:hypothetical protein